MQAKVPVSLSLYLYLIFIYSARMRKVFIADAHLRKPEDENYRVLLRFLAGLKGNTDTLYILGDLFEFWIGYRKVPFTHYFPVMAQLKELQESGTAIVYFEGNHDFHLGPFFAEELRTEIHRGPALLTIDGKRVYICHGDQINRREYGYRLLRFIMHNRLSLALVPLIPPALPSFMAVHMGRGSKKKHHTNKVRWDYDAILREFAAARFREGCDLVISAHFHRPFMEQTSQGRERILLSLGDWISQFSYGEWADGKLSLKTYR